MYMLCFYASIRAQIDGYISSLSLTYTCVYRYALYIFITLLTGSQYVYKEAAKREQVSIALRQAASRDSLEKGSQVKFVGALWGRGGGWKIKLIKPWLLMRRIT